MSAGRSVVVAVRDAWTGHIALQRAVRMVSPQDRIHLVHVPRLVTWHGVVELMSRSWLAPDLESDADRWQWLRKLSASAGLSGPAVDFAVLDGEPGTAIVDFACQKGAVLIVVATPREGQAREMFIGSTALRVLRTANCPVLVARREAARAYEKAVLALDLEASGERVSAAAATWLSSASIDAVHAYRMPQEGQLRIRGVGEDDIRKLRRHMHDEIEEQLKAYRESHPRFALHVEHGFAESVILDNVLRLHADILVVGKHRGTSNVERILGSITQFLLYACPTDILLVP